MTAKETYFADCENQLWNSEERLKPTVGLTFFICKVEVDERTGSDKIMTEKRHFYDEING